MATRQDNFMLCNVSNCHKIINDKMKEEVVVEEAVVVVEGEEEEEI